ncbi:MAG: hypothetical protein QOH61_841 [Chloroflexota bacterium]|jgi:hypothetical protein|nr:hypothetical protein [Chloroflexota bacterium]
MSRPSLVSFALATVALLVAAVAPVSAASPSAQLRLSVDVPKSATPGRLAEVTLKLPASVAAVDGRLLIANGTAELIGLAPVGGGSGMRPEAVKGGYAFGAYGLRPTRGTTVLRLVLNPLRAGKLQVRVLIDSVADAAGRRISSAGGDSLATLGVAGASTVHAAPSASAVPQFAPTRTAAPVRKLIGFGKISRQDIDAVRLAWDLARTRGAVCGTSVDGDANDDGCTDIVDLQAVTASLGTRTASVSSSAAAVKAAAVSHTYVVTSSADRTDASIGDGTCADSQGNCTLRAALQEADWLAGDDRIEFNIPGGAPALIQINSSLPPITSRNGTLTIDGYTEPGSRVNDAAILSNAIPGVEIRGNGTNAREIGLRITSFGNTIRGLAISSVYRGIFIDGANAHDNRIVGNWIGFRGNGTNTSSNGQYGILLNVGANANLIGTPDLADRNLSGNWSAGIDEYGPGTDSNVIQNNVMCIRPNGATATCATGMDHNFGPKFDLIGGTGVNEKNVFGPTTLQAVEYSHGWNPSLPWGTDTATTYQINNNRLIGNWLGFRGDGSYDANYRSGLSGGGDNGNGVNVYDGSNNNLIRSNYVGSARDGIQVMAPNARGNEVRDNIIGQSPLGQAAPLSQWGIKVRWSTSHDVIAGNIIRNAALGGIGLTEHTVFNIRISQNIVSDTNGPAISLAVNPQDNSQGANNLVPAPVITSADTAIVRGTATADATVEVYQASRQAGQNRRGLPSAYLGSTVASASGHWALPISGLVVGDRVSAIQIRTDDNTSEFAVNVALTTAVPIDPRLAADDFSRTVAGGWGTAVVGGDWAHTGTAANHSVSGGAGHLSVAAGAARDETLAVGATNATISGTVNFDKIPTGGAAFAYALARQNGTTAYRAQIRLAASGALFAQLRKSVGGTETAIAAEVPLGMTATPSTVLGFRLTIVGAHLQFRVWNTSGAEPGTWQTEADDASITGPGGVGLRAYTGAPVSNGPVVYSFDDFLANPAP